MSDTTTSPRTTAEGASVRPFEITVPEEDLVELRRRIAAVRLPSKELVSDRSQGVQLKTIQELAQYWTTEYNWRRCQARLNALPQFKTTIDGGGRSLRPREVAPRRRAAIDHHARLARIIEMLEAIGPLTDPTANDAGADDAFDPVVPSIPG